MTDHSPCLPHFLLLNAESKSSSRTNKIRHYNCHIELENNTSGRARLWDTALKYLCPGLFITSPDHLAITQHQFVQDQFVQSNPYCFQIDAVPVKIVNSPSKLLALGLGQQKKKTLSLLNPDRKKKMCCYMV